MPDSPPKLVLSHLHHGLCDGFIVCQRIVVSPLGVLRNVFYKLLVVWVAAADQYHSIRGRSGVDGEETVVVDYTVGVLEGFGAGGNGRWDDLVAPGQASAKPTM